MNAAALLDTLEKSQVAVSIRGDGLHLAGPSDALKPFVSDLKRLKPQLLSLILQKTFAVELTAAFLRLAAAYRPGDEYRDIGRAELTVLTSEMRRIERGETSDLQAARDALAAWERAYQIAPDIGTAKNDGRKNSPARARYIIE